MPTTAGRTYYVQEAPINKLLSESRVPEDAISLGQGVPFFGPPEEAITAATKALTDECCFRYTEDAGLLSLRQAIATKLEQENNITADPESNIMVTSGGNQAFINALMGITEIGDDILILAPYYFNNIMAIKLTGCNPIIVNTNNNYQPEVEDIISRITVKTRAIVTISPNNPTGAVYPRGVLEQINKFCAEKSIFHISDEAYEHFIFDDATQTSPMSFDTGREWTISLFSFSKSFGMSGYRVGYMVYPARLNNELLKVQDTIGICPPGPSQAAAEAALGVGAKYPKAHLQTIDKVRKLFIDRLKTIDKIDFIITKGSFYFLIKVDTIQTSWQIAKGLIEDHGVITIPGNVFGSDYPALRISYGNLPLGQAQEGIERLVKGLDELL
ncbi:aminotransferase class I/II-fold pyridoxal phosphate-dependent enzyme [[Eubacterium] cellulosolvens]